MSEFLQGFFGVGQLKAQKRDEEAKRAQEYERSRQFEIDNKLREEAMLRQAEQQRLVLEQSNREMDQRRALAERGMDIEQQGQQQRYALGVRGLDLQQLQHLQELGFRQEQFDFNRDFSQQELSIKGQQFQQEMALQQQQTGFNQGMGQQEMELRRQQEARLTQQGNAELGIQQQRLGLDQQRVGLDTQQFQIARQNGTWQKTWADAEQIMKVTGDPNQAAAYVNKNLPGMNLQVTGMQGEWVAVNSAMGPFAFDKSTGEFKPAEGFMVPPPTREIDQGGSKVTQDWQGGQWNNVATSPKWKPEQQQQLPSRPAPPMMSSHTPNAPLEMGQQPKTAPVGEGELVAGGKAVRYQGKDYPISQDGTITVDGKKFRIKQ